jgi:Fur family ferric uptake transcriptional regulator
MVINNTKIKGNSMLDQSMQDAEKQVRDLGHRVTSARVVTLAKLIKAERPMTHDEMLADFQTPMDRVTLYRVLDWLVTQGLAHRITAEDRVWRFMSGAAAGQHPHFYCENTGEMLCLSDIKLPDFNLPAKFKVKHVDVVFHGTCEE